MHGFRSLPRFACAIGCAWLLLDSVPSLAAMRSNGVEIMDLRSAKAGNGQWIEAAASVNYQHKPGFERIYSKLPVHVPKSTLRVGALAALSKGVMHPGFQIAIAAAGFVLSQNNQIMVPDEGTGFSDEDITAMHDPYVDDGYGWRCGGSYYCADMEYRHESPLSALNQAVSTACSTVYSCISVSDYRMSGSTQAKVTVVYDPPDRNYEMTTTLYASRGDDDSQVNTPFDGSPTSVVATESDLQKIDEHIPPELLSQLYDRDGNIVDIPVWQDEISVIGMSGAKTNGNVMPEVMSSAKSWAENVAAQLDGEELPNPDKESTGDKAVDARYKQEQEEKNTPPPPFADVEVEWQTEEITDIPSWSSGIGAGSCPAPVEFSMSGQTVGFDYEPVCRGATAINPFFLGFCGLMALYIVLGRQRAGG